MLRTRITKKNETMVTYIKLTTEAVYKKVILSKLSLI